MLCCQIFTSGHHTFNKVSWTQLTGSLYWMNDKKNTMWVCDEKANACGEKKLEVVLWLSMCAFERKRDTKRDGVRAWVTQAIVPENLTRTQDILQTFMQQWFWQTLRCHYKESSGLCVCTTKIYVISKLHRSYMWFTGHCTLSSNCISISCMYSMAAFPCNLSPVLTITKPLSSWRDNVMWFHKAQ